MKIRALIVDDEPLARERVRTLLQHEPDIEILGECDNGNEAIAAIRKQRPDLVFLDVQMPGLGGFDVLRGLGEHPMPLVIFVTAHDQHALKAFEVHALDYLLKPFKQVRFKETVQRARAALASQEAGAVSSKLLALLGQGKPEREYLARIPVRNGERLIFIKTEQIEYMESAGNYIVLHTGKENHVVRETLTGLEGKLDPRRFVRINRSTLVNLDQIKELQPLFRGDHAVLLHNGKQLTMTRGIREVQELIKFSH